MGCIEHRRLFRKLLAVVTLTKLLAQMGAASMAQTSPAAIHNQAIVQYGDSSTEAILQGGSGSTAISAPSLLIDPLGQVLGCDNQPLADYSGFRVGLYEPDITGLELGTLVPLPTTEVPDLANNAVPGGKAPNITNVNPFALTNDDEGAYNFLFDPTAPLSSPVNAGLRQTSEGARYILVVSPPSDSPLPERRVLLEILNSPDVTTVRYLATALDGQPLSTTGGVQLTSTAVEILDAETQGLNLTALGLSTLLCRGNQVEVTKAADRAAVQPGDAVVYRLALRNNSEVPLTAVRAVDQLPFGFQFLPTSLRGAIAGEPVTVVADPSPDGRRVVFSTAAPLPAGEVFNVVYALQVTPDGRRGRGRNTVTAQAVRSDNRFLLQDGPVAHQVRLDPGLLADGGTLIGRVFVDNNFDGEQQPGEPGIPNAVVFLDDGNRIITDADGLFSVANMLPGRRTGTLDLNQLPGYTLAPNLYRRDRNGPSRLVHLAPGGLVRMNFAVTPAP